jgi:hypothetical protein
MLREFSRIRAKDARIIAAEYNKRCASATVIASRFWRVILAKNAAKEERKIQLNTRLSYVYGYAIGRGYSTDEDLVEQDLALLGLTRYEATLKSIDKALKKISLKYHPDKVPADRKDEATAMMARINAMKPRLRESYRTDPLFPWALQFVRDHRHLYSSEI